MKDFEDIEHMVATLPIDMSFIGIEHVRDNYGLLPDEYVRVNKKGARIVEWPVTVGDICARYDFDGHHKCFAIRGCMNGYYRGSSFHINPRGPHVLCFIGFPKGLGPEEIIKYRFEETLYRHYWEDNKIGYLTQVVSVPLVK